jgi:hypothetical protein
MRLQAGRSQQSNSHPKWTISLVVTALLCFVAVPAYAQAPLTLSSAAWVNATITSVAAVIAMWIAAMGLSALSLKMRWVNHHGHSRLTRNLQVVFGGLLLSAMLMPYLVMHHPVVAAGLLVTGVLTMLVLGSKSRQLQSDSKS